MPCADAQEVGSWLRVLCGHRAPQGVNSVVLAGRPGRPERRAGLRSPRPRASCASNTSGLFVTGQGGGREGALLSPEKVAVGHHRHPQKASASPGGPTRAGLEPTPEIMHTDRLAGHGC